MSDATPEDKVPSNKELQDGLKEQLARNAQIKEGLQDFNELREALDGYARMLLRRARRNARDHFIMSCVLVGCIALNIGSSLARAFWG